MIYSLSPLIADNFPQNGRRIVIVVYGKAHDRIPPTTGTIPYPGYLKLRV